MNLPLTPVRFKGHAARVFGHKIGVVCEDLRFTYREFNERCDGLSQALLSLGLESGGENVASAEVERVIYGHPAVLECAVIPVPDEAWGEVGKAFVALKAGQRATEPEILGHCREHLAGFKVPKSVEFMETLPKGGTGKILKKVLREKYWAEHERKVN